MNIYQKTCIAAAVIAVGTVSISEFMNSAQGNGTGAPASRTGSPFDSGNCTFCHTGFSATTDAGLITSNIPASGYLPGVTYTITASISVAGVNKYGFEISPQGTTGAKKGTMIVTTPTDMQLISSAKYMTHKSTGTAGTGGRTWSFNWTAPALGSGNVTFYGAFVAANGNGSDTGDHVHLSSMMVSQDPTAGIAEQERNDSWSVYPNPAVDKIFMSTLDQDNTITAITLSDITGKQIKTLTKNDLSENNGLDIGDLQSGMYVLTIRSEKGTATKKIIKK
ncbi:MAG: choice-of-anchor V domain-containing protein [Bacteroidia bacterium]